MTIGLLNKITLTKKVNFDEREWERVQVRQSMMIRLITSYIISRVVKRKRETKRVRL